MTKETADQKTVPADGAASSADHSQEGARTTGGPLGILFPPDVRVWSEARKLVADRSIRIEDLATCATQDPVIVIELLRTANAMFFSGGRSPITSVKTALVRLGSDVVQEMLDKLKERPLFADEVSHWFEIHRSRCKRSSIVGRILSEALARQLSDEVQTAALLLHVGELLAVAHFRDIYTRLAEEQQRTGVNYRLVQDHKFDVERMGVSYLKRSGIPEGLLFAIDREARSRAADRAIMKPLCHAAGELVDAFDTNRWEKLAPGRTLNPKSSLRLLQIPENQYLKIYERCSEYLFSAKLLEEKQRQLAPQTYEDLEPAQPSQEESALQSEIRSILEGGGGPAEAQEVAPVDAPVPPPVTEAPTAIAELDVPLPATGDHFSLGSVRAMDKTVARVAKRPTKIAPPKIHTAKGTKVVSTITSMFDEVASSEELLAKLLEMLVDNGPFEKSALIVVSRDRSRAIVVAARGPSISNGQELRLDDPLSPLAHCISKLQSFGNKKSKDSPWGSKSFALSPIDADHDTPVALYADCGEHGALTFEARRIFRTVVGLLNERLPTIPGGIPVELKG